MQITCKIDFTSSLQVIYIDLTGVSLKYLWNYHSLENNLQMIWFFKVSMICKSQSFTEPEMWFKNQNFQSFQMRLWLWFENVIGYRGLFSGNVAKAARLDSLERVSSAAERREGPKLLFSTTLAADRCRGNCYYQLKYQL